MNFYKNKKIISAAALVGVSLLGAGVWFLTAQKPKVAAAAAPAAAVEPRITEIATGLLHLKVKAIPLMGVPKHHHALLGGGGHMAPLGKGVIFLFGDKVFYFNPNNEKITPLHITLPKNNYQSFPSYGKWIFAPFVRYEGIQVIKIKNKRKKFLLVSYTFFNPQKKCLQVKLARTLLKENIFSATIQAEDWKVIFQTPCTKLGADKLSFRGHESGGAMTLGKKPHTIYLALSRALGGACRKKTKLLCSILEIHIETGKTKIIARGVRNVQGITLDKQNRLWTTEHGPRGGDEVNLIQKGKHYGWPQATYGTPYEYPTHNLQKPVGQHKGPYEKPRFAFMPSIGIADIIRVKNFAPHWNGDLLVTSLRGRALYRLRLDGTRGVYAERIVLPPQARLRSIVEHPDGYFIVLADHSNENKNFLYTLRLDEKKNATLEQKKADKLWGQCVTCHSLTAAQNPDEARAPSLENIFGKKAGKGNWPHYTDGMKGANFVWDNKNLRAFLTDPQALVPGTSMPRHAYSKEEIDFILSTLKAASQ